MVRKLICIICPKGCRIDVELDEGEIKSVSGNTCPRGEKYAKAECVNPLRTVTSTVRCSDGTIVAVKTDSPIPKDKVFDCMKIINNARPVLPISVGDVIIKNVFGSNIVAVSNAV